METGISQTIRTGLLSDLDWSLNAGVFTDTTSLHFSDYRHFKTNPLYIDMAGLENAMMFTDYYQASSNMYWVDFHANFTSSYLFLKFLPWLSAGLWKESLDLAYHFSPGLKNYFQLGYSLDEIFFLLDVGIYVGFMEKNSTEPGSWGFSSITGRMNFRF